MADLNSDTDRLKQIAVFASGTGSNAQKIIDHFRPGDVAAVVLLVCNNPHAGVLEIAKKENIPVLLIERKKFNADGYLEDLEKYKVDLLVLAGFLWKIPDILIRSFPHRIINIHPALLPKYGGKNMYGNAVHEAVIHADEKESGITIHYVDEQYDHGDIIFQETCALGEDENAETLAQKIHLLEHRWYPVVIERILRGVSGEEGVVSRK